jgi:hypothetical protein
MTFKQIKIGEWFRFTDPTRNELFGNCQKLSSYRYIGKDGDLYTTKNLKHPVIESQSHLLTPPKEDV